jgi:cytochrome c553
MTSLRACFFMAGLASLALPLSTALAAPPAGRLLAAQCAQCHGTGGQSASGIDSLAGESASELYSEMLEMKYSQDTGDIMHRQARGYTEEQIRLIANYYATLSGGGGGGGNDDGSKGGDD